MSSELDYQKADPFFKRGVLKEFVKEDLKPTERSAYIFLGIFLICLLSGLFSFQTSNIFSGNLRGVIIKAGYPLSFFKFDLAAPSQQVFNLPYLFVDLIVYLLLSYLIDILITAVDKWYKSYFNVLSKDKRIHFFREDSGAEVVEVK
jgi:hypothetical protein